MRQGREGGEGREGEGDIDRHGMEGREREEERFSYRQIHTYKLDLESHEYFRFSLK